MPFERRRPPSTTDDAYARRHGSVADAASRLVTALYAVVLAFGIVLVLAWIILSVVAGSVDGWARFDPEDRFGPWGRRAVAATLGAGMGGMSATYAGWSSPATVVAAVVGGGVVAALATWLAPTEG